MAHAGTGSEATDHGPDIELDLAVNLDETIDRLEQTTAEVTAIGEDTARQTRQLYDRFTDLMDRYEEPATGTGEFLEYVAFQDALASFESDLENADVTDQTAFEDALSRFDRRIVREKDFRRARDDLTSVKKVAETLSEAEELASTLVNERGRLSSRLRKWRHDRSQVQSRLSDLEAVTDVDPDPLVSARSTYNERVCEEFDAFAETAPAIDVARVGYKARLVPLAEVPPITDEAALSVLEEAGFATETVPTVLEYASYSDSKLSHYVDQPERFRSALPISWFETVDGEAFTIASDATGDDVRHRAPALVKVIDAFASPETIAELRTLRDLAAQGKYDRMRRARRLTADDAPGDVESARSQLRDLEAVIDRAEAVIDRIDAAPTLSG